MRTFWKVIFSIFMAAVILLAIEYVALQDDKTNSRPVMVIGIAQAMIIYRAITSLEAKAEGRMHD